TIRNAESVGENHQFLRRIGTFSLRKEKVPQRETSAEISAGGGCAFSAKRTYETSSTRSEIPLRRVK
ncbi:MAG TPA: hypothetical protein VMM57_01470, partial [Bacteroidota bacterium]|nr:hypothetical protein [Bacteroidota bacterium]